ncbi:MAG: leader peptide processing enzyme [Spirochaetaceae bacterium]|jgi:membrane protein implicated in regulation of membrane protease activity|nr:leader peptide processing enzyme [Spirochaetaceae bacterium]
MSKKTNTLLFILAGTILNILLTIISLAVLMILYFKLLAPVLPENVAAWGLPVLCIAALGLSFVAYRLILKQVIKRIDMEKYFDPIFNSRRSSKIKD